ncbi:hypothetical protein CJJ23_04830 [Mycoplasmopsis agassizii]|uniref:Uncharacterized protein n=1 Tax=Mycoplasmopsis agassizii TaxID=33922 RepID=A0A269THM0_9BACT|nr:hypothetical protein [Mycoplasmopsis agassizii]PAK20891.1 hypothetical protein CJJ23_04830 [Mycoplasmopsis agassizii]
MLYDEDGSFKKWHSEYKGSKSKYELNRIEKGETKSRTRKVAFKVKEIIFVALNKQNIKNVGVFQDGFKNSDGSKRNPKVLLDLSNPDLEKYVYKVD